MNLSPESLLLKIVQISGRTGCPEGLDFRAKSVEIVKKELLLFIDTTFSAIVREDYPHSFSPSSEIYILGVNKPRKTTS